MNKYLFCFLLFSIISIVTHAQTHELTANTRIIFYPVSNYVKQKDIGFDCFYETGKAYVKGNLKLKPQNRLFPNAKKLTPLDEICLRTFEVINTSKIIIKKRSYYVAFLIRDDGKEVTLALPFVSREEDNLLTHGMIKEIYDKQGNLRYGVNIPFIECEAFDSAKQKYTNRNIIRFAQNENILWEKVDVINKVSTEVGDLKLWGTAIKKSMYENRIEIMNENKVKEIITPGVMFHAEEVNWWNSKNCLFQQPAIITIFDGKKYGIPIVDIYGYANIGENSEFHGCKVSDFYMDYEDAIQYTKNNDLEETKLPDGSNVYYKYTNSYEPNIYGHNYRTLLSYEIKKGKYKYLRCGLFPSRFDRDLVYSALVVSSSKDSIVIAYKDFCKSFISQEQVDAIEENNRQVQIQKDKQTAKDLALIEHKYGKRYSTYFSNLSDQDKEKFMTAASKWGARDAKDIVEGYVRIGWSKEKCRMSWGDPRDINKTIGSWGTHEQWCYYSSYLYFDNGKLTSIQN